MPVAETADKLEALRQKQEEVQRQEREFQLKAERKTEELSLLSQEIERREVCPPKHPCTVQALHKQCLLSRWPWRCACGQ